MRVDLVFLIDASSSIERLRKGNFARVLNFIGRIINRFSFRRGRTRVGVIIYSSRVVRLFGLNR